MRFHHEQFLNEVGDCEWLSSTHLKALSPPAFKAFTLYGNEDCPARLDLFLSAKPEYNTKPVAVYRQNGDGDLTLELNK